MHTFADMLDLFPDKFSGLGAGGLSFPPILGETLERRFIGHGADGVPSSSTFGKIAAAGVFSNEGSGKSHRLRSRKSAPF